MYNSWWLIPQFITNNWWAPQYFQCRVAFKHYVVLSSSLSFASLDPVIVDLLWVLKSLWHYTYKYLLPSPKLYIYVHMYISENTKTLFFRAWFKFNWIVRYSKVEMIPSFYVFNFAIKGKCAKSWYYRWIFGNLIIMCTPYYVLEASWKSDIGWKRRVFFYNILFYLFTFFHKSFIWLIGIHFEALIIYKKLNHITTMMIMLM